MLVIGVMHPAPMIASAESQVTNPHSMAVAAVSEDKALTVVNHEVHTFLMKIA